MVCDMKDIIVTGAAQGLGKAIATQLVGDGFRVIAIDVQTERLSALKSECGHHVECFSLDVTDYSLVEKLLAEIESDSLFGLVNNAGIYLGRIIQDYSVDDISKVLDTNLKAAIYVSKFFGEILLKRRQEGVIVNMSSSSIYGGADPVYSASKAGLVGLTKSCALKFSPFVRVNAVAPGIVETELLKNIPPEVLELYRSRELVKKPITPADVAGSVSFLLSESGRNYTGAVFDLNNGFHL